MSNNAYGGLSSINYEGNISGPSEMGRLSFPMAWKSTFHSSVQEHFMGVFYLVSTALVGYSSE